MIQRLPRLTSLKISVTILYFLAGMTSLAAAAAPSLTVGNASGQAGATVDFPVDFNPGTQSVAGFQFDLTLPANVTTVSVTATTLLTSVQKSATAALPAAPYGIRAPPLAL